VATIAVAYRVDQIAAQSHQLLIFSGQIQRDRRYRETYLGELSLGVLRL